MTDNSPGGAGVGIDFNPHSHEGSDKNYIDNFQTFQDFNPHSHEGSDDVMTRKGIEQLGFQSTLPRRE